MGYRYIGSKARIAEEIMKYVGKPSDTDGFFIDAFSGTGIVSEVAADYGWRIVANDMMNNAIVMTEARLIAEKDISFSSFGGYNAVIDCINNLVPQKGFFWREYSPASLEQVGIERKYFTEENAAKIDAASTAIHGWHSNKIISDKEYSLLLSCLMFLKLDHFRCWRH